MDPATNQMRFRLCQVYNDAPGWVKRVNAMSAEQVWAIYQRFKSLGFDPEKICASDTKRKRYKAAQARKKAASQEPLQLSLFGYKYICLRCMSEYVRDNPELDECEFCGSHNIERHQYI